MTNSTFSSTCADDGSVNEYACVGKYMYKLWVMVYQIHFYKHVTYHKMWFYSVWATGILFVENDALEHLTGNSEEKILK